MYGSTSRGLDDSRSKRRVVSDERNSRKREEAQMNLEVPSHLPRVLLGASLGILPIPCRCL